MPKTSWSDLSSGQQRLIVASTAVDLGLKAVALVDLKRRPADQIRGPKKAWGAAITLINGFGIAPISYFLIGRR